MISQRKIYIPIACLLILGVLIHPDLMAQESGPEATIVALKTQVSDLQTQVADLSSPTPASERTPVSLDPLNLAEGLTILSYRFIHSGLYIADSEDKATWVVGEMQNTTDQKLDAPGIQFILTDDGGNIIGSINADPILPVILPGQVMPFQSAIFGDEPSPEEWIQEQVELCSDWGSTRQLETYDPTGLEAQDLQGDQQTDNLSINGKVLNNRDQPAENVWIKVAIYNEAGEFSGWFWSTIDVAIPAGKTARFEVNSRGDPHDPVGVAGPNFTYQVWVGFDSSFGVC